MKKLIAAAALAGLIAGPALAALKEGENAPQFTANAFVGGKPFTFNLDNALKKGPVVLYFFPAAFTKGCTIEAHEFADAAEQYHKLGATLIGITAGNVDRVGEFSTVECRAKFPVAADPGAKIAETYHSKMAVLPYSERTSYVIVPDGKVILTYTDMAPDQHVSKTLDAVKTWRAAHPM
ncbi:MAG TPA: peroxiredoxin [Caulobacteraceae bacterium]|jgi:peroxiredoxin Q/BCP|nr:peroxiredoxin [Caulobacteraceae bacterium]